MRKQYEVRHILTLRYIRILIVIAIILFLLLGSCTPFGVPYEVSKVRMTYCGESQNICTLNGITEFEVGDEVCIAWTDVNRSSSDTLSVFIYQNGKQVYDVKIEEEVIESKQQCRTIPVETTLSSGLYKTEVAVNGRPEEQIVWAVKQSPPYSVENPRMTICNSDVNVCQLEGVSQFSLTDEICTAWTEVDRSPNDSFAFFVYGEKDEHILRHIESKTDSRTTRSCRVEQIKNPNVLGSYRTEFTTNGHPVEEIFWSVSPGQTLYHMNGDIGCIDYEPIIFFEGDVDTSINEGEFLIKGAGADQLNHNYVVEVLGKFDGQEILSGEIRMYLSESYREDHDNQPFRIDSLEGIFKNLELYSVADRMLANGGCEIFTRIYLEEPTVGSTTETPPPRPIACNLPPITKNLFPQLADVTGQYPMYGPLDDPHILCQAVYDIVHTPGKMAVHIKYENVGTNLGWWGVATPNGYDASQYSKVCFWAYAQWPNQSFRVKMKDNTKNEKGVVTTIDITSQWTQICTELSKFSEQGIQLAKMDNVNLGFEQPTGSAEVWVADFEFK